MPSVVRRCVWPKKPREWGGPCPLGGCRNKNKQILPYECVYGSKCGALLVLYLSCRWDEVLPLPSNSVKGKIKCTLVQALRLCTGRTAHRGSRGIALLFLDHDTRRGEESASRPGRSLPPEKTRYPLYRRLGGHQGRSGQVRKIWPPQGFNPRNAQSVASRCTDYAARPTSNIVPLVHVVEKYGWTPQLVWNLWLAERL